ncbi:hypothetical protein [Haloarchaeobius amylolyticus]|uniref:hypothetical protein n=1 Tax=Haloarchaeobius amylolyticus TaxID=1198296 RepID=UPI00226F65CA|nr:hypothetical protein [Haloarchaeobius amylolyticus]
MSEDRNQSKTDESTRPSYWDWYELAAADEGDTTGIVLALIVVIMFSIDLVSFEWAVVAMLGVIAATTGD